MQKMMNEGAVCQQQGFSRVTSTPFSYYHTIRVNDGLGEPCDWQNEIATVENASPSDIIHFKINCPGGREDTLNEFLSAIAQTDAHVICEAVGIVASAATLLFLAADEFRVNEGIEFFCHTASFGSYGKENNVFEQVEFSRKSIHRLLNKSYEGFFTPEEIERILNGSDYYLDTDQVMDRLEARQAYFEKIAEDEGTITTLEEEEGEVDILIENIMKLTSLDSCCINIEAFGATFDDGAEVLTSGELNWSGETDVLNMLQNPDIFTAKDLKCVADALGVSYNKSASVKQMHKIISEFVEQVVDILNS